MPPQGFLASTLSTLTLLLAIKHHEERGLRMEPQGEYLEFEGDARDLCRSLAAAFTEALEESPKPPAPAMHQNDRAVASKMWEKLGGGRVEARDYTSFFEGLVKTARGMLSGDECMGVVSDLSRVRIKPKAIELGEETFAPLQVFKIEKYEYGKDFLDLRGIKADLRMSAPWTSLAASGWLLSYMGNPGALLYSLPPDDYVIPSLYDKSLRELVLRPGGVPYPLYYSAPSKIGTQPNPPEAYGILLALTMPLGDIRVEAGLPPLRMIRVLFDGRRFTALEDSVLDTSPLIVFAKRLSVYPEASNTIRSLARCTLMAYSGRLSNWCRDNFGDFEDLVRMIKAIYGAAMGSLRPETTIYMLARLSPTPMGEHVPPFRRHRILGELMSVLGMQS